MNRFDKQIILKGFGVESQHKLNASSVLVVGAGGLGCPVMLYLAAAGIGKIGIADGDSISISNLNRQVIYKQNDESKNKAIVAAKHISEKYNDIHIIEIPYFIDNKNALQIIQQYDVIVDCCDNFTTRYLLNDACVLLNKPLVYAAIFEYEGQVSVFNLPNKNALKINYRDLFPNPPKPSQLPDCNTTGVLGVLPGIVGIIQATETIKIITGIGQTLVGEILYYNLLQQDFYKVEITPNQNKSIQSPKNEKEFSDFDYENSCTDITSIDWSEAESLYVNDKNNTAFIDVRELNELPKLKTIECFQLPTSQFTQLESILPDKNNLLVFCLSGTRSMKAIQQIKKKYPNKNVYSIKGGILSSLSPINKTATNVNY